MRVLVGPREVAGLGADWVAGLRASGAQADLVCAYGHPFAYAVSPTRGWLLPLWEKLGNWRLSLPRKRLAARLLAAALHQTASWLVVAWALRRYDAFVFLFGETLTNTRAELMLLRWLGKRVVVVFCGSDARPAYIDGQRFPSDRPFDADAAIVSATRQRRKVQRLERWTSVVVSARNTAQFLTLPFINWFALGIPRSVQPAPLPPVTDAVRVLHSPSHPVLKGTAQVRETIQRLRARGVAVELVTIQGRPNAEVLQALRGCHLVVDQLYSDTPMAAFATEAASLGRAVIVCGCAAQDAASLVAPFALPPTLFVRPEDFEATLQALVQDAPRRESLGAAGAAFVAAEWTSAAVGTRLLRVLRDDIPADWWCTPADLNHVVGCGLPEAVAREHVAALIRRGGVAALQVGDKPELEQAFVHFAGVSGP
jgi:hypothetical protein